MIYHAPPLRACWPARLKLASHCFLQSWIFLKELTPLFASHEPTVWTAVSLFSTLVSCEFRSWIVYIYVFYSLPYLQRSQWVYSVSLGRLVVCVLQKWLLDVNHVRNTANELWSSFLLFIWRLIESLKSALPPSTASGRHRHYICFEKNTKT